MNLGSAGTLAGEFRDVRRAGKGAGAPRFMASLDLQRSDAHWDHEPSEKPQRNEGTQSWLLRAPSFLCGSIGWFMESPQFKFLKRIETMNPRPSVLPCVPLAEPTFPSVLPARCTAARSGSWKGVRPIESLRLNVGCWMLGVECFRCKFLCFLCLFVAILSHELRD